MDGGLPLDWMTGTAKQVARDQVWVVVVVVAVVVAVAVSSSNYDWRWQFQGRLCDWLGSFAWPHRVIRNDGGRVG